MKNYKVVRLQDDVYQVLGSHGEEFNWEDAWTCFQGDLADCNAWLQLNDKGYFG
jgi:hypothetical protein